MWFVLALILGWILMPKQVSLPLTVGGQYLAGDAAAIPDGYCRSLINHLPRPGRCPARPPFVYDNLMGVAGLANFDDQTNRVTRLVAINVLPTPSTPTVALVAGAGNVNTGTHTWKVTFVNGSDESTPSAASSILTTDTTTNGQVTVTIPTCSGATCTSRKIYRRVAGNTGDWKLAGTVANNSGTSFTDNIADGSLGAVAPTGPGLATLTLKGTSGETWGASTGTISSGTRLSDYTNYRGTLYGMLDSGTTGLPTSAFSFDGNTLTSSPFNSTIAARTVTAYNERLFMAYPRLTVAPQQGTPASSAYDFAGSYWTRTNVNGTNITDGTRTVCRVAPTSTAANACKIVGTVASDTFPNYHSSVSVAVSTTNTPYVFRHDIRAVSPTYSMPLTLEVVMCTWTQAGPDPVPVGYIWTSSTPGTDAVVVRCTTSGTVSGGEPTWSTTLNGTTSWGTAVFTTIATTNVLVSNEIDLGNATDNPGWQTFWVPVSAPWAPNIYQLYWRIKFGNTLSPSVQLVPIDLSSKDGITNGYLSKQNYGFQATKGDFYYPFFNVESASSATIDMPAIVWSEIASPKEVRAVNYYNLLESVGFATASTVISNRLLVFKRSAFWQFQGSEDPDNPIRRERIDTAVGCIGPRALDVFEDEAFFIGENEVYRYRAGDTPKPFAGDAMREEMFAKGANWVESAATYNMPLLSIDKSRLLVYVYTQANKLYVYDLRTDRWATYVISTGYPIAAMNWNTATGNFYVSIGGYGLCRIDYTSAAKDTIDNTATPLTIDKTVVFKPIEAYQPPLYDMALQSIRLMHAATASQTNQTLTAYYSFDQGTTYDKSAAVTLSPLSAGGEFLPVRIAARQGRATITVKLVHSGSGGETNWCLGPRCYANLFIRRETTGTNNTVGSATL